MNRKLAVRECPVTGEPCFKGGCKRDYCAEERHVNRQAHEQPAPQGKAVRRVRKPTAKEREINLLMQAIFRAKEEKPSPARERELRKKLANPEFRRNAMKKPPIKAAYYTILAEKQMARAKESVEEARRSGFDVSWADALFSDQ